MSQFTYRLAYYRPRPGTDRVLIAAMAPAPLYVATNDYLTRSDFVAASATMAYGEDVVRATLSPGGREKYNQIAEANEAVVDFNDYTMLLLHVDGQPDKQVTLVKSPISGFEVDIRGIDAKRIPHVLADFGVHRAH